jgi:hypothetical protein
VLLEDPFTAAVVDAGIPVGVLVVGSPMGTLDVPVAVVFVPGPRQDVLKIIGLVPVTVSSFAPRGTPAGWEPSGDVVPSGDVMPSGDVVPTPAVGLVCA